MSFDSTTRNKLQRMVAACRRLLTEEFDDQLQSLYGIYADEGRILDLAKLTHLDDDHYQVAILLRDRIEHIRSGLASEKNAVSEAIRRVQREQAFTLLNRFAALRMAEERGLVQECVAQGLKSKGFQVFETVTRSGLGSAYERYHVFIRCMFDELSLDLGVLFDQFSPFGLLFPREQALLQFFDSLNEAELKALWQEDETIGWIYQYFNDEAERKKMRKESAAPRNSRELAVRNQFFTPRYVVQFLTDNTLGRIWYEMTLGQTRLKDLCLYMVRRPTEIFLKESEAAPQSAPQPVEGLSQQELLKQPVHIPHRPLKDPRTILMLDPACGSMHFGLYAFDLFEVIYAEAWDLEERGTSLNQPPELQSLHATFSSKDEFLGAVPKLIIENNIHGVDIDPRCAQIAGLSLWLRAQKSWQRQGVKSANRPRITRSNVVCAEPMPGKKKLLQEFIEQEFGEKPEKDAIAHLVGHVFNKMQLAGEAGSLLQIEDEIRTIIADAKAKWKAGRGELFSPSDLANLELRPSNHREPSTGFALVTDEDFFDSAEQMVYDALQHYAEQAEIDGGFQRRLFADDAARGFAFIDVCRKRYDVALMNPPFGSFSKLWIFESKTTYPNSSNDILGAFVERFLHRLHFGGRLGAITARTCFFLTSFREWRLNVVLKDSAIRAIADLGQGVMDSATVEAAAYILESARPASQIPVFRAIADADRELALKICVDAHREGRNESRLFLANQSTFHVLPDSPFVYWIEHSLVQKFTSKQSFEEAVGTARQGLATADNPRFARAIWEVNPNSWLNGSDRAWVPYILAGPSQPWFSPITLLVNWAGGAAELWNNLNSKGKIRSNIWMLRDSIALHFFRPGFSWTRRAVRFIPYVVPAGCVPSASRYMAFPRAGYETEAIVVCASRMVSAFLRFYAEFWQRPNYLVENLKMVPWPTLDADSLTLFREHASNEVRKRRTAYQNHEPFHEFLVPSKIKDFSANGLALAFDARSLLGEAGESVVAQAYGFNLEVTSRVERDLVEAIDFQQRGGIVDLDQDNNDEDSDFVLDFSEKAQIGGLLSYVAGCSFGRWDIRYATNEKAMPELPDPFAPLPVCPPAQLQNAHGLPAGPEDVPACYPIRFPWHGILVNDPRHPWGIEHRVREVIEIIWKDRSEAIENEICEKLGVKSLSDFFHKPTGFFTDHLGRYSKSRRQAPIYWPLSSASGSYTLWVYYHRLTDQTLFHCVNEFVKPKLEEVKGDADRLRDELGRTNGGTTKQREQLQEFDDFLVELTDFHDELLRVAGLPYKPNLNDGVLITASPLWKLFRLPKWQKDLKACWEALSKGEYDWAHLAYTIWPDRVKELCRKDRSVAIAHGLEDLCEVKAPVKKQKRGKKEPQTEENQPELTES